MKGYMGRKTASGLIFSRGGYSLAFREESIDDRNIKYCSRLRCSASLHSMRGAEQGKPDRAKSFKNSQTGSSTSDCGKPCSIQQSPKRRMRKPVQETIAEISDKQEQIEDNGDIEVEDNLDHGYEESQSTATSSGIYLGCEAKELQASSSSTVSSGSSNLVTRHDRHEHQESSSFRSTPRSETMISQASAWTSQSAEKMVNRANLGSSSGGSSGRALNLPQHFVSERASRYRNQPARTSVIPARLSSGSSIETAPVQSNVHGTPTSTMRSGPTVPDPNISCIPSSQSYDCQQMSMGVAEVLLALERIEQDEELTYEQLLVLGTNFLLDSLSFHDEHRDMRMDIEDMTYEELLALEERIGTVTTALTEEALSKCLTRSSYMPAFSVLGVTDPEECDLKCTICQEEYAVGEELGKLACEHSYHVTCVQQWLRLKNWCPVCKEYASHVP